MEIIWKGIPSASKRGLIITSLPPITKPPMMINETTIEGRDGSIIEELGFEAYDKVISIGLTRNYNIDDIIAYFNGAGTLTMSNEPDKVYNARIISQIDYQRLLRFRTADIYFRVQPYKYKESESEITIKDSGLVVNQGNTFSKPIITIEGSGTVEVSLNSATQFTYTFPTGENKVIIDSEMEDAYLEFNGVRTLKNRNMVGEFMKLNVDSNIVDYTGNVTSFKIQPKSRWI